MIEGQSGEGKRIIVWLANSSPCGVKISASHLGLVGSIQRQCHKITRDMRNGEGGEKWPINDCDAERERRCA